MKRTSTASVPIWKKTHSILIIMKQVIEQMAKA